MSSLSLPEMKFRRYSDEEDCHRHARGLFARHGCLVDAGGSAVLVERLCLALLESRRLAGSPPPSSLGSLRLRLRVALLSGADRRNQRWSPAVPALVPAI